MTKLPFSKNYWNEAAAVKLQTPGVINQNHPLKLHEKLCKIQVAGEACTPNSAMSSSRFNALVMRAI